MATPGKTTPPSSDPRPGENPGYAEEQPRDREDAQQREPRTPPDPEDGGLHREPETTADPASQP